MYFLRAYFSLIWLETVVWNNLKYDKLFLEHFNHFHCIQLVNFENLIILFPKQIFLFSVCYYSK
jgi:hypothetical protein